VADHDWKGGKQEKLRLYWKVREVGNNRYARNLSGCDPIWGNEERGCGQPMRRLRLEREECGR